MIDPAIRAVYFDAVGTLLFPRSPVSQTYAEMARKYGATPSDELIRHAFREAFAKQEKQDFRDGWKTDEARERMRWRTIVGEVFPETNADACFAELWEWFGQPAAWVVQAEAGDVIREIRSRNLVVGIASNFDSRLYGLVDAFAELTPLKERCVVSSLVGRRKPGKEFFAAVAKSAGVPAEHILFVGDDLRNDIHGATAAGMKAIFFDPEGRADGGPRIRKLRDLLSV